MALRQADRLESNNPKAYGVVRATEVAGHKSVKSLSFLYLLPDCILSDSKTNNEDDAIGQSWYVIASSCSYRLIDWENRHNSKGWRRIDTADNVDSVVKQVNENTEKIGIINGEGEGSIIKAKLDVLGKVSEDSNTLEKLNAKLENYKKLHGIDNIKQGSGIEISKNPKDSSITVSSPSEIDDTAGSDDSTKTWSISKINAVKKINNILNGKGIKLTSQPEDSGVVKIDLDIDDDSIITDEETGKLSVNNIDGGTYNN